MSLQTFTWNNGTNANPVVLNSQQLGNLLKIATNNSIQSDVRGHITTSSGQIAKYIKWQLEQKYGENLVIHAEPIEDAFSIFAVRGNINEGDQTEIIVTGVSPSSVKFRMQHSFRNVYGIQQSAAQARIHMEGTTLVVDNPQENASWTDVVTVQAILSYEDWNEVDSDVIQTCTVTITAKELTGISLTAPQQVTYGSTFESTIALLPNDNTKRNFVTLDANCTSNGSLVVRKPTVQGTSIYTVAPAEECSLTLIVNAYLFNDLETIVFTSTQSGIQSAIPSIIFTVTTDGTFSDISTANPKITLQKVDSGGTPIGEPIILTGTVSGSSLVYTYGNGNVAGDGSETYKVTFGEAPEGYRNIQQQTITPNQVVTEIGAQYIVKRPGFYQVYADGYEPISAVEERGGFISGRTRIGVGIVTDETQFIIGVGEDLASQQMKLISSTSSCPATGRTVTGSGLDATEDYDGERNTIAISNYFTEHSDLLDGTGAIPSFHEKSIIYGNRTFYGYIPACGQLSIIIANLSLINSFISTYYQRTNYIDLKASKIKSSTGHSNLMNYWGVNGNGNILNAAQTAQYDVEIPIFEFDDTIIPLISQ